MDQVPQPTTPPIITIMRWLTYEDLKKIFGDARAEKIWNNAGIEKVFDETLQEITAKIKTTEPWTEIDLGE